MTALGGADLVVRTESTLRDLATALGPDRPFLVLKGVQLGATYYARPEDRPHNDIDILVRAEQFDGACEALSAAGFRRKDLELSRAATARAFYNRAFFARSGMPVELHRDWAGYGRYPIDAAGLFGRAVPFRYGRTDALGLSPEDLLLHLCVHMAKGYFASIDRKHVEDLRVVLARPLDWPAFLARASAARCRVGAYYALLAGRLVCGARVPDAVLTELRPSSWRGWWIERSLNPGEFPVCRLQHSQIGRIQACLFWPLLDRPADWARVFLRFLRVRVADALLAHRRRG